MTASVPGAQMDPDNPQADNHPKLVTPAAVYLVSEDAPNGRIIQAARGRFASDAVLRVPVVGNCRLLIVLTPDKQVACGGIFTYYADVIQYHLGGTAASELRIAPSKLMFDTVIADAATAETPDHHHVTDQPFRWLHLGGGVGAKDDNLARFKKGFSNREHWFRTLEMIHDPSTYKNLSGSREDAGFFPLYRSPE